jgi:hypothetical protein
MNEAQRLHKLMPQFPPGGCDRFNLRLWRDCGLRRNTKFADQIRIAEEVLADASGLVASPWIELRDYLIERFNDPDAEARDDAIQDLVTGSATGFGFEMGVEAQIFDLETTTKLIQILVERLLSPDCTNDDRVTAAGLLPKLGTPEPALISVFLTVLAEMGDDSETLQLRRALVRALAGLEASPE